MSFSDTGFAVRLLSEEDRSYYSVRVLELQNTAVRPGAPRCVGHVSLMRSSLSGGPAGGEPALARVAPSRPTGESRQLFHFHYTTWPDFGVRESGSLGPEHGPPVVHCSAGIGRSGTLALVDTCLVLVRRGEGGGWGGG
ncbi:Tyrosine-protein phosphatase non-receptor type 2 [Liparis tanakae]|uniref:protein-tyrosine-phosphatase n=1 Tax=Liparis tanakae TaxID=230148 RepID=A0A4Z2E1K0_9TELE|nr:Tyrosine-protein phosphatase non-receptor type 2 [Liparis tanakae]